MSNEHADDFRESYPATYAEILRRGQLQERSRTIAHLDLGASCHAEAKALEAIRAGTEMSPTEMTSYMQSAMNHADRYKRQAESNAAENMLSGVDSVNMDAPDLGDQVVAKLRAVTTTPSKHIRP